VALTRRKALPPPLLPLLMEAPAAPVTPAAVVVVVVGVEAQVLVVVLSVLLLEGRLLRQRVTWVARSAMTLQCAIGMWRLHW
jgi:hypothetical protein